MNWLNNLKSSESIAKSNPLLLFAILIELLFIILIAVSVARITKKQPSPAMLTIDDYSAATKSLALANIPSDISDQYREIIGVTIYDAVKLNSSGSVKNSGAQIRPDSIVSAYIEDLDTNYLNFIIDIPDLKQSYRLIYRDRQSLSYGQIIDDTPLAVVYCLRDENLLYEPFDCKDAYDGKGETYVIAWALAGQRFEHSSAGMVLDPALVPKPSISIITESENSLDKQTAITEVADFLSTLGFSLEDYPYAAGIRGLNLPEQL